MTFFGQRLEDKRIAELLGRMDGLFFLDVGAWEPEFESVTKAFYDAGSWGVNLEPNPFYFQKLKANRPRDINLPIACGEILSTQTFWAGQGTGLSTFVPEYVSRMKAEFPVEEIQVRVVPLREICNVCVPLGKEISFLKIDAEGWERHVLLGNDWDRWRPRIVIVEATKPCSDDPTHEDWEDILIRASYRHIAFDGLNRWYVEASDPILRAL